MNMTHGTPVDSTAAALDRDFTSSRNVRAVTLPCGGSALRDRPLHATNAACTRTLRGAAPAEEHGR
jgi:hypothetical protein